MKLLSMSELKTVKGIFYHPQHIRRLVKEGKFPAPIKIGENRNAFLDTEIDQYIEEKIANRDAAISKETNKETRQSATA